MSEFGAFRSTNYDAGPVDMNFTCVLQVCKDDCEEVSTPTDLAFVLRFK